MARTSDADLNSLAPYVIDFVGRFVRRFSDSRSLVLDVGCGRGQYALCTEGSYVGLDMTSAPYDGVSKRNVDVIGGADRLPFKDGSVDLILTVGSFYQVADYRAALEEFRRVLKPGGRILLCDYNRRTQRRLQTGEGRQRPCWTHSELRALVAGAGFAECEFLLPTRWPVPKLLIGPLVGLQELAGTWAIVTGVSRA